MSDLAGSNNVMMEVSRAKLLLLIQNYVLINGVSPIENFELKALSNGDRLFDGIFDFVSLEFVVGTPHMNLHMHFSGACFWPDGQTPLPLQDGEVVAHLDAQIDRPLDVSFVSAELSMKTPPPSSVLTQANQVLTGMFGSPQPWDMFPDTDSTVAAELSALLYGGSISCLDADTLVILDSGGDMSKKTRTLTSGHDVALGLSANFVKNEVLCPALITAILPDIMESRILQNSSFNLTQSQIDDIIANPSAHPTESAFATSTMKNVLDNPWSAYVSHQFDDLIPPSCGTTDGVLTMSENPVDAWIDSLQFTFQNGFIQIDATFKAKGPCLSIDDGALQEKVTLTISGGTVNGKFDPATPNPTYTLNPDFWCELLAFFSVGIVMGDIANAVLPPILYSVLNSFLAKTKLPKVGGAVPELGDVTWDAIGVTTEGIIVQGTSSIVIYANPTSSVIWFDETTTPSNVQDLGSGVYHFLGTRACQPHDFTYEHLQQDETIEMLAKSTFLIDPVTFYWSLDGTAISGSGTASFNIPVQQALPPPNGTWLPAQTVQVGYGEGWPFVFKFKGINETTRMVLSTRAADLDYPLTVTLTAKDASGREFSYVNLVNVVGDLAQFGSDYYDYMKKCEMATLIALSNIRTRPLPFVNDGRGIPNEQVVNVIREAIASASPSASVMLKAFSLSRGVTALSGVFSPGAGAASVGVAARAGAPSVGQQLKPGSLAAQG